MTRVAAIGECMVELRHSGDDTLSIGFAGDTFNTAAYLARSTAATDVTIDYVTVVGDDYYSDRLVAAIQAEGIGTGLITRRPRSTPGLYLVRTDLAGERHFTYHRGSSPARTLFADTETDLSSYDVLYLSAITLQILAPHARERLWAALDRARRAGGRVAFDGNYRPAGWATADDARGAIDRTLALTDIALPTLSDEQLLHGDADALACARRIAACGPAEVVVKDGAGGCVVLASGEPVRVAAVPVPVVVDTTAAGDSFNAGYLSARLQGASVEEAARAGHALASTVIQHAGAIVPPSVLPRRG